MGEAELATQGAVIGRRFANAEGGDWALPYWRADTLAQDTRLWPGKPQEYSFDLPGADSAEVKLVLRRGSPALLKSHGLNVSTGKVAGADLDVVVHNSKVTR